MKTLEEFARIRADIERTGDPDGAARRVGLGPSDWAALEHHWQAALAQEIAGGGHTLTSRYGAALAEAATPRRGLLPSYLAQEPSSLSRQPAPAVMVTTTTPPQPRPSVGWQTLPPDRNVRPTMPFTRGPETRPEAEPMTLEQYAGITILLTREGQPESTLRRLGIAPARWMTIVRRFSARFEVDSALASRFQHLVSEVTRSADRRQPAPPGRTGTVFLPPQSEPRPVGGLPTAHAPDARGHQHRLVPPTERA